MLSISINKKRTDVSIFLGVNVIVSLKDVSDPKIRTNNKPLEGMAPNSIKRINIADIELPI